MDLPTGDDDWERRIARCWAAFDAAPSASATAGETLVAAIDALAGERAAGDPAALFERAAARDSTGDENAAAALYREALGTGRLDAMRRARATLQLGSTLRLLGELDDSERLLRSERRRADGDPDYPLSDELAALLALTRIAQGHPDEAAALALSALVPHLSRYRRSMAANAAALLAALER